MAYKPTVWVDSETPVNAENLNKLEAGVSAAVVSVNGISPDENGNVEIEAGGLSTTAADLLITILREGVYNSDQSANITALAAELAAEEPDTPVEPDEPVTPEKTLTSISATYSGGNVAVGTAVTALTGVVVTAHYSDGTSATVTGYTLSGTIAEGSNTITVGYGGKTTTFTVTGVAESGGDDSGDIPADATRLAYIESSGTQYINTGINLAYVNAIDLTADIDANVGTQADIYGAYDGEITAYFRYYQNATVGKWGHLGGASNFTCAGFLGESMRFVTSNAAPDGINTSVTTYWSCEGKGVVTSSSVADTSVGCGVPLYLFARNNNGTASQFASYKLREFVIYSDWHRTTEILHLLPAKDANGVVCMYDTVSKQYFRNSGTGDFVGGEAA